MAGITGDGPVVIALGTFSHEGIKAKAEALGFQLVTRNLRSTPGNWKTIAGQFHDLIDADRLPLIFLYLSSPAMLHLANRAYDEVRPILLGEMERTQTLVFVYEDALRGVVRPFPWELNDDESMTWRTGGGWQTREEWVEANKDGIAAAMLMLDDLARRRIDLLPFRTRADVTLRLLEALEDAAEGVFLRLYVPHGRYQSAQFQDFLMVFNRFLREVEGREFSIDTRQTPRGTAYLFRGRGDASTIDDLRSAISRFDEFLTLSLQDPTGAEGRLVAAGTPPSEAVFIVARYQRALRRLVLEARHDFQRRQLVLAQRMESELLDSRDGPRPPDMDVSPSSLFSIVASSGDIHVSIASLAQSGGGLASAKSITKTIMPAYGVEDDAILERIDALSDIIRALELRSDLDGLKDPATGADARRNAAQRLKGFIYESARWAGRKADTIATQVLIHYLDGLVNKV